VCQSALGSHEAASAQELINRRFGSRIDPVTSASPRTAISHDVVARRDCGFLAMTLLISPPHI
jgi:hypothetical protein